MKPTTLFTTKYEPAFGRALDVLAFVLTPSRAFASNADELVEIENVLLPAKRRAIAQWMLEKQGVPS